MKITNALANRIGPLLSADDSSLGPASGPCVVALIENEFTEAIDRVSADLTRCAVAGLTPIAAGTGDQVESIDPVTGEIIVEMKPPAGGFRFECTSATGLPKTIFGIAVLDTTLATLWMCERFDDPITITAVNQAITLGRVGLRIDPNKILTAIGAREWPCGPTARALDKSSCFRVNPRTL